MGPDTQVIESRRAEAIVSRTRRFAGLFAVLTVLWIVLDALVLDGGRLVAMMALRSTAAAAFGALAISSRIPAPTMREARARLGALLAIPVAFFLAALAFLPPSPPGPWGHAIADSYAFFPFLLAAGIGAFPLTVGEIVAAATGLAAVEALVLVHDTAPAMLGGFEMLWLLALIAIASGFGASSQLKLLRALVTQAIHDPLTGCLRREGGAQTLALQFAIAARHHSPLAVLFADIDRFKRVNDAFGHEAGDRVLAAAALALRAVARETDTLVRWGGEEFVLVLPHTTGAEATALVERLGTRGLGLLPDGAPVTVSIGISHYPGDGAGNAQDLVALADRRMYRAKEAGRNRIVVDDSGEARVIVAAPAAPLQPTVAA